MSYPTIPFLPEMTAAIVAGRKTATTRTRRYCKEGEYLDSPAGTLRVIGVSRVTLEYVARNCWRMEGFASEDEFRSGWARIHPRKGYDPDQMVWLHSFELIDQK